MLIVVRIEWFFINDLINFVDYELEPAPPFLKPSSRSYSVDVDVTRRKTSSTIQNEVWKANVNVRLNLCLLQVYKKKASFFDIA